MQSPSNSLSRAQLELLEIFSRPMSEKEIEELRDLLSAHYAKKLVEETDRLWDERGYTQATMDEWLNQKS